MKKLICLLMLAVVISAMVVPAAAISTYQNNHQCINVVSASETVKESTVYKYQHLTDKQLMAIVQASIEAEEGIVPEGMEIKHLTLIRQKKVTCETAPIEYSFHTVTAILRNVVVVFKAEDSDTWQLVACAEGNDIDASLPGNGMYAVATSW